MQQFLDLVRQLRQIYLFKVSMRSFVIVLMVLGAWVATEKLVFPPSTISVNDKLIHIIVFFGFSVLVDLCSSKKPFWLWKGLPLLGYGMLIEVLQYFTPHRSFSIPDMIADSAGISLYLGLKFGFLYVVKRNIKDSKFI